MPKSTADGYVDGLPATITFDPDKNMTHVWWDGRLSPKGPDCHHAKLDSCDERILHYKTGAKGQLIPATDRPIDPTGEVRIGLLQAQTPAARHASQASPLVQPVLAPRHHWWSRRRAAS